MQTRLFAVPLSDSCRRAVETYLDSTYRFKSLKHLKTNCVRACLRLLGILVIHVQEKILRSLKL